MEEEKVKLRVMGLTNSQIQSGAYALVLAEEGMRRLPVIVGTFEAQSIAIAIEGIKPPRPLTHDLVIALIKSTGMTITEVFIYKFEDSVFFSEIVMTDGTQFIHLDSRTSDAIALALRAECAIYTTESIMKECGVVIDEISRRDESEEVYDEVSVDDIGDVEKLKKQIVALPEADLEDRMGKAVAREDYELAKIYRDELLERKNKEK
ncbi:MAG: bifunctional nuclease family protein [Tannerella sp.]|jgi:bifunctional DNase/RNase|nr:bifunctional nuclease family protein [Tannerella sp.]